MKINMDTQVYGKIIKKKVMVHTSILMVRDTKDNG